MRPTGKKLFVPGAITKIILSLVNAKIFDLGRIMLCAAELEAADANVLDEPAAAVTPAGYRPGRATIADPIRVSTIDVRTVMRLFDLVFFI
jgi:hypothetical protein